MGTSLCCSLFPDCGPAGLLLLTQRLLCRGGMYLLCKPKEIIPSVNCFFEILCHSREVGYCGDKSDSVALGTALWKSLG